MTSPCSAGVRRTGERPLSGVRVSVIKNRATARGARMRASSGWRRQFFDCGGLAVTAGAESALPADAALAGAAAVTSA